MNIRLGKESDVKTIGKYLKESWIMHCDNEPKFINKRVVEKSDLKGYFRECFNKSNKSYLLIAEEGKELAGFCKLNIQKIQRFFNQTKVIYVDDVYVMKKFRGQGLGKLLLDKAEKIAKERKIKWAKARIYLFNKLAIKLFEKTKYRQLYSEYFKILK